jgi:hypothetical protein
MSDKKIVDTITFKSKVSVFGWQASNSLTEFMHL